MTDNEIIKALECCTNPRVNEKCPRSKFVDICNDGCIHLLMKQALNLINRQKAEIERLKEPKCVNIVHARSMGKTHSLYRAIYTEAIKEFAERLKNCFCVSKEYLDIMSIIDNIEKEMVGE